MQMNNAPPHSKKVEEAVIGSILTYPEEDFSDVDREDFYLPNLWDIVEIMKDMKDNGKPIDLVTLYEEIKDRKLPIRPVDIAELAEGNFVSSSLSQYKASLKDYRRKREQYLIAHELATLSDGTPAAILDYSERLRSIAMIGAKDNSSIQYDDVNDAYEMVCDRVGKSLYWYSWWKNFEFLDQFTKGIIKSRVYRIGAWSNIWKSQFIYNVIVNLLEQTNPDGTPLKIAFFTLENTREETLITLMCNARGINPDALSKWEAEWDWEYLTKLKDRLYIIDSDYELSKIFSRAMKIKPDVVVLDYISLMDVKGATEDSKYWEYARKVARFAKSQNMAWIDLSNLPINLQTNDEIKARPQFFWSSLLKNNCDVAIHIMSNEQFKKTKNNVFENKWNFKPDDLAYLYDRNMVDLVVTKNRWGTPWVSTIYWANKGNGWRWREMSKNDLDTLWGKYG